MSLDQIEETVKTRNLLMMSESDFDSISKSQRRELLRMKNELTRERSLRGNLAKVVDRIRNDNNLELIRVGLQWYLVQFNLNSTIGF